MNTYLCAPKLKTNVVQKHVENNESMNNCTIVTSAYGKREVGMERSTLTGWLAAFVASNSPSLFQHNFSLPTATCAKILIISDFCFKWKTNKGLRLLKAAVFQSRDLWCGLKSSVVKTFRLNSENDTDL